MYFHKISLSNLKYSNFQAEWIIKCLEIEFIKLVYCVFCVAVTNRVYMYFRTHTHTFQFKRLYFYHKDSQWQNENRKKKMNCTENRLWNFVLAFVKLISFAFGLFRNEKYLMENCFCLFFFSGLSMLDSLFFVQFFFVKRSSSVHCTYLLSEYVWVWCRVLNA